MCLLPAQFSHHSRRSSIEKNPDIRFLMHTVFLSDIFYKIRIENPIANMDDRSANAAAEQVRVQPAAALGRQHESNASR